MKSSSGVVTFCYPLVINCHFQENRTRIYRNFRWQIQKIVDRRLSLQFFNVSLDKRQRFDAERSELQLILTNDNLDTSNEYSWMKIDRNGVDRNTGLRVKLVRFLFHDFRRTSQRTEATSGERKWAPLRLVEIYVPLEFIIFASMWHE